MLRESGAQLAEALSQELGARQSLSGALSAFSCPDAHCHMPCNSARHRRGEPGPARGWGKWGARPALGPQLGLEGAPFCGQRNRNRGLQQILKGLRGGSLDVQGRGWWGRAWTSESDTSDLQSAAATHSPRGLGQVIQLSEPWFPF